MEKMSLFGTTVIGDIRGSFEVFDWAVPKDIPVVRFIKLKFSFKIFK